MKTFHKATGNPNAIQEGEIVECILLKRDYITRFKKKIDEYNATEKAKSEAVDLPWSDQLPTFKDCGVSWEFAVISRSKDDADHIHKVLLRDENGEYLDPGYKFTGRIEMQPIDKMLESPLPGNKYRKIGTEKNRNGFPELVFELPESYPSALWEDGKLVAKANEIAPEDRERFINLLQKDAKRLEEWKLPIEYYKTLNEKDALEYLEEYLGHAYLFCCLDEEGTEFHYYKPQVGLRFRAKVYYENSKYMAVKVFDSKWDYASKKTDNTFYATFNTCLPTKDDITMAEKIIDLKVRVAEEFNKDRPTIEDLAKDEKPPF